MPVMKFKRFNKPQVLKQIGRQLLAQFFERFKADFEIKALALPPPELPDNAYFPALPGLLARTHNAQRLRRLTAFQYAGCKLPKARRLAFSPPTPVTLEALAVGLDNWFDRNHRGQLTTRIEVYPIDGEHWFLVRHGDSFTRAPKVEQQETQIIHFRPERDDVIVYCPEQDEIRINARTKGERDLYTEQFALHV